MTKKQNSKDSSDHLPAQSDQKMKIALFIKPSVIKAYFFILGISFIASMPFQADASLFSDITDLFLGTQVKAEEGQVLSEETSSDNNSQNMNLTINSAESSMNPDIKNADTNSDMVIVQSDSFIYSDGMALPDVSFEKSPISDQIMVYTVVEGDTLSGIAEAFDVSINTIRWENKITGNTVSIGKKLNILPITGVKHIVGSGDTISKIATKYDADSEDILIFNGLEKGYSLNKGDLIFIPNGIIKVAVTKTVSGGSVTYSNTKAPSGYYLRPVPGRVTSPYGSRKGGFHPGVDLAGTKGVTPVMAAASGVVIQAISGCKEGARSCGGRYGNYITIEHPNGTRTRYAHLSRTKVSVGQSVSQGQTIGILGNTGYSTGPHLHFEIINANGSKMRPAI